MPRGANPPLTEKPVGALRRFFLRGAAAVTSHVGRFFIIAALAGNLLCLCSISNFTTYVHGAQSFFYVAHLAYALEGKPATLPVSFLELYYQSKPNQYHDMGIKGFLPIADADEPAQQSLRQYFADNPSPGPVPLSRLLAIELHPETTFHYTPDPHAAQYAPLAYAPFVLGAWVGLKLELPPLAVMYLAVICNMALAIALGFYTLRLFPAGRWWVAYLLLVPTAFEMRSYIMPDALLVELCLLALGIALRFSLRSTPLEKKHVLAILLLSILIGATKCAYIAVPLVFVLIPARLFSGAPRKTMVIAAAFLLGASTSLLWGGYVYAERSAASAPLLSAILEKTPDMSTLSLIRQKMLNGAWLEFFINSMFRWGEKPGNSLELTMVLLPLCLLLWVRQAGEGPPPPRRHRLLAAGIFAATGVLVFTAIYYTHLDTSWIGDKTAFQGRHMLPVLPFLLYSLMPAKPLPAHIQANWNHIAIILAVTSLLWLNITQLG
jgi:hypothetical protein